MELKPCPSCRSKAIRDDKLTEGVEGAIRCSKCSFCALIGDWQSRRKAENVDFPILRIIDEQLKNGAWIEMRDDKVCLINTNPVGIIARGENLKAMLMEAVFILC